MYVAWQGRRSAGLFLEDDATAPLDDRRLSAAMGLPWLDVASTAEFAMVRGAFLGDQEDCMNATTMTIEYADAAFPDTDS